MERQVYRFIRYAIVNPGEVITVHRNGEKLFRHRQLALQRAVYVAAVDDGGSWKLETDRGEIVEPNNQELTE